MPLSPEVLIKKNEYQRYQELGGRVGVDQFNWAIQLIRNQSSIREKLIREGNIFQSGPHSLSSEVSVTEREASIYTLLCRNRISSYETEESFSRMCDQSLLVETFLLILTIGEEDKNVLEEKLKMLLQDGSRFPPGVKKKYERVLHNISHRFIDKVSNQREA